MRITEKKPNDQQSSATADLAFLREYRASLRRAIEIVPELTPRDFVPMEPDEINPNDERCAQIAERLKFPGVETFLSPVKRCSLREQIKHAEEQAILVDRMIIQLTQQIDRQKSEEQLTSVTMPAEESTFIEGLRIDNRMRRITRTIEGKLKHTDTGKGNRCWQLFCILLKAGPDGLPRKTVFDKLYAAAGEAAPTENALDQLKVKLMSKLRPLELTINSDNRGVWILTPTMTAKS